MNNLDFIREQAIKILDDFIEKERGVQELLKLSLEAFMRAEREIFKETRPGEMNNGYRFRKTFGQSKLLELRVPRTRFERFYPNNIRLTKRLGRRMSLDRI